MELLMSTLISRLMNRIRPKQHVEKKEVEQRRSDPLDPFARIREWNPSPQAVKLRKVSDFPIYEAEDITAAAVGDSAVIKSASAMDDSDEPIGMGSGGINSYTVPQILQDWYMAQGFPGYQSLAIIAQHWMVEKACSMAGKDAVRNGWKLKAGQDELTGEMADQIAESDKAFKIRQHLVQMNKFKNMFGIRIVLFEVESDDPGYYEKPFNIDGITEGSYKGISQVDPYWMMPMMTAEATSDPSSQHFYDPEYWIISGKKFHRSHLIIARGPEMADILKPTYIFGGISLVQRIYERIYAAERTANEAPLLAMNKRTTAIHVDMDKAVANEAGLLKRLGLWIRFRDNHAVKVLGQDETMEQFDTSLADFDNVIMSQYQLVAAIAEVPATKLLGTPPKGFNATGEFEMVSYHESLESIQEHDMQPLLDRHYLILTRSLGLDIKISAIWEPVDSMTTSQLADLNDKTADTDTKRITAGIISPDEARNKLRQDRYAGYSTLTGEEANTRPGMSPENIAAYQEAAAESSKGQAAVLKSSASASAVAHGETTSGEPIKGAQQFGGGSGGAAPAAGGGNDNDAGMAAQTRPEGEPPMDPYVPGQTPVVISEPGITNNTPPRNPNINLPLTEQTLVSMLSLLDKLADRLMPEGGAIARSSDTNFNRTTSPSVQRGIEPSVSGMGSITPHMEPGKLPKMKLNGMVLAIENPRGSIRRGMDVNGVQWSAKMSHPYGFIKGTKGADGDDVDCFVGDNLKSQRVFVINQNDPTTGEFDEHKCMIGFDSPESARKAYDDSFSKGWAGFDSMYETGIEDFKAWAFGGVKDQPFANPLNEVNIGQAGSFPETA
jgi:phage-related protein (TIGR01555 family)